MHIKGDSHVFYKMIIGAIIWKKTSSDFILEDLVVENDNHHANRLIRFYTEPIQPLLEMGTSRKLKNVFQNHYSLKRQLIICVVVYTHSRYFTLQRAV